MNEKEEQLENEKNKFMLQGNIDQINTNDNGNMPRQSNFELLRIICMILIVMHHYALHSGFQFTENITINKIIVQALTIDGNIGVDIFVIITGYFMVHNKFKAKKVINIFIQTFTYSIIFLIFSFKSASFTQIIRSILPIIYSQYWFVTTYIFLYILSPFINKLIYNIEKNEHKKLLLILLVVECILPTFFYATSQYSNIVLFVTLYILGAYIRKYYYNKTISNKINIIITSISYLLLFTSVIVLDLLSSKISILGSNELYFSGKNSVLVLMISVSLFCIFKNLKMQSRIINYIATTVLGIYMIHDNMFMRDIIWKKIVQGAKYINSPYLIINAVCGIFSVFVICSIIEMLRQKLIEPIQNRLVDKILKSFENLKSKITNRFSYID